MPAAAVIPAPIAYIKVAAVKKLVVESLARSTDPSSGCEISLAPLLSGEVCLHFAVQTAAPIITLRKIEFFKQAHAMDM